MATQIMFQITRGDGGVERRAFAGDLAKAREIITGQQADIRSKDPAAKFVVMDDDDPKWAATFGGPPPAQADPVKEWEAVKNDPAKAVLFLGRQMGLEARRP